MMEPVALPLLFWVGFAVLVIVLLALDFLVLHRKPHEVRPREALLTTAFWFGLAAVFGVGVGLWLGTDRALEFATGYLVEWSLSVDNLFVFLMAFSAFSVPAAYQHRVLFWGILGAVVMRVVFILLGAALLEAFHWIIYLFGAFLLLTAVKLAMKEEQEVRLEKNLVLRIFRRFVPTVSEYHGARFTAVISGKRYATPLLLVLVVIEATDLVFAIDSIPAIFAVTRDPFIVYTSNIFAILGLRSLYFLLGGTLGLFRYLKTGLALVLFFIGAKMIVSGVLPIHPAVSLAVVVLILVGSIGLSLLIPKPVEASPSAEAPASKLEPAAGES